MAASSDLLGGRYRLEAPLGAGGMATVHRAHDVLLGRQVAIKFLASNVAASQAHLERFGREARAMAALNHPNLVAIYDVGWADEQAGQTPYLVMELVPGGTLSEALAAGGPLDPPSVTSIVEGLASALDALHKAGIVHRDIKPQNVLLAPTGPKLGDLGVVRVEDPTDPDAAALTASGATPGTLRFLAPEVIFGQGAGPKADAYALAVVAFEAVTGQSPRPAATLADLVKGAWQAPVRASEARPELGRSFDAAFAAGLELDPNRRLDAQSFAAAMWEALTAWAAEPRAADQLAPDATGPAATGAAIGAPIAVAGAAGPEAPDVSAATAPDVTQVAPARADVSARRDSVTDGPAPPAEPAPAAVPATAADGADVARPSALVLSGVASPNPLAFRPGDTTADLRPPPVERSEGSADDTSSEPEFSVFATLGLIALVLGIAVVGLLLLRPGFGPGLFEPGGSPSAAAASPGPSPSPTPGATDEAAAAAQQALDRVVAAIEAARGGPDGLKGGDANDLLALAGDIERALEGTDYEAASSAAEELAKRAEKLSDELDDERSDALLDAIEELQAAIPST